MTGCQRWASTLTTERGSPCRVEQSHSVGKHTMRRKMLRSRGKKTTVFDYVKTISKLCTGITCVFREFMVLPLQCMMRPQSSSQTCLWYIYWHHHHCNHHHHPFHHHHPPPHHHCNPHPDDTSLSKTVETGQEPSLGDGSDPSPLVMDLSCYPSHHHHCH